jgi:hypothetical protein
MSQHHLTRIPHAGPLPLYLGPRSRMVMKKTLSLCVTPNGCEKSLPRSWQDFSRWSVLGLIRSPLVGYVSQCPFFSAVIVENQFDASIMELFQYLLQLLPGSQFRIKLVGPNGLGGAHDIGFLPPGEALAYSFCRSGCCLAFRRPRGLKPMSHRQSNPLV